MRVLLGCSLGGEGHLLPLATVGQAIARAGHAVKLLVAPAMVQSAERTGLSYDVGDEPARAVVEDVWQRVRTGPPEAVAGLIDRELFAARCTEAMLPRARELGEAWLPDLIVREPCEYATAVVAHEAGIAQAQVGISQASIEFSVLEMVAPIIDEFATGLSARIETAPYLSSFPPSLDPSPWPDTRRFRASTQSLDGVSELPSSTENPFIYMTFGTVLGHLPEAIGTFRCALDAVADLPARVLLTTGRAIDIAKLGPIPNNVRVEPWVPQASVLARAALVVCHGGSGTTMGALGAGVPLVICPLFADQSRNGQLVEQAGAGVVVVPSSPPAGALRGLGPEDVSVLRERIERVLRAPSYRTAARRVQAEMSRMLTVEELVEELGRLGAAGSAA